MRQAGSYDPRALIQSVDDGILVYGSVCPSEFRCVAMLCVVGKWEESGSEPNRKLEY